MGFLYSQLLASLPYPVQPQTGRTVVITGSNTGLGKEAAKHFARLGAGKLILAVRSISKGEAAKADMEAATQCGKNVIEVWKLDMASFDSVKHFARRLNETLGRLDVFIANAGVVRKEYHLAEGLEESITVNFVSTFLLAGLILPKMKETANLFSIRPTLSITSSGAHAHSSFPQKDIAPEGKLIETVGDREVCAKYWDQQYPLSKLLEIFAVRSIGKQSPQQVFPVTINCVDPGFCHSDLAREHPTWGFFIMKVLLARSTEQGSRTLVHGGNGDRHTHGRYLSDCIVAEPHEVVTKNVDVQDKLWRELSERLEVISPGVMKNFKA
ncbi:hypothetical protein CERZMDRAFT_100672 [Cercospora zeae-maydis SCOH1-5]|uniref:Uncharacterized protein n=1 Tax=Cercospora zeae-maydis SCOH1-5 TaxID=717836 RepID=A0A6A6F5G3_9PEZI|nr:hypothetical protein CERZMDRAFT_100672 [Cercospora zeae-maydis SCOH1-5]